MNSRTHPFRVERVNDPGSDLGQHKTEAGALSRVRRLVAMSNGKRTAADFRIVNDMRKKNPVKNYRYGTSYFRSKAEAIAYFKPYGYNAKDIATKIRAGDISIGKPTLKAGEKLDFDVREGRYFIYTENPKRRKKKSTKKKVRAKSRVTVRYKITAQNTGKRMHYDGRNFSERKPKLFALADDAKQTALALIRRYSILRKYRVRVESFP